MKLTKSEMEHILMQAKSTGADFSEIFFEDRSDTIIKNKNRSIQGITSLHIYGAGIYVLKGTASVYVYSNDTSYGGLMELAKRAASLIPYAEQEKGQSIVFTPQKITKPNPVEVYPGTVSAKEKIRIVKEMEQASYSAGPKVLGMNVEYYDNVQNILVVNSEGLYTEDQRVFSRVRLSGAVGWREKSNFEFNDFARPQGFEAFRESDYIGFAKENICQMEERMKGRSIKSCQMPVVFEGGDCGVFWHESCGHNLESTVADSGIFAGKLGQQIASSKVTLVDDGSMTGMYGSEAMDDEGHPTQKNILIENGIMKGYLCDRKGGRILGCGSNGSGRRQSYTYAPCARMHNTYLAPGEDEETEMISSLENGLFVTKIGGGSSGANFSIEVKDGFLIQHGKITDRVSGINLSGISTEIIKRVDRVGKILVPEIGGSFCGAASGLVPTTAFQPRFRVSAMNVGGTEL